MTPYDIAVYVQLGLACATFIALWVITAPYGRHARPGWGPSIPARLGWVIMELPAMAGFTVVFLAGTRSAEVVPLVLLGIWQLHYLHRTLVFPLRMPAAARPMPIAVMALGFGFNCLNAWINARWISHLGSYPLQWLWQPRFLLGTALFVTGWAINLHADTVLLRLRKAGTYAIPTGGLYRWISCPNYLGEVVEWTGWAIATWSLAGLAFAAYTAANLLPRAVAHHRWYCERFETYPLQRRAIIPYLL